MALTRSGSAFPQGANTNLLFGDSSDTTTTRYYPKNVTASSWDTGTGSISVSASVACQIESGTLELYCWGSDGTGAVGTGAAGQFDLPQNVLPGTQWKSVFTSSIHTCGILVNNTLLCWGSNLNGILGDGTVIARVRPVIVNSTMAWVSLPAKGYNDAGAAHTCAIQSTGDLWCWGPNSAGQLGIGTIVASPIPALVSGGLHWTSVALGDRFTCGITDTERLLCWVSERGWVAGRFVARQRLPILAFIQHPQLHITSASGHMQGLNSLLQLGNGPVPAQVLAPNEIYFGGYWTSLSCGKAHTCAIRSDKSIWCWGLNANSELGDGTTANRGIPILTDAGPWALVTANDEATCALDLAGKLSCWGINGGGQLGTGRIITLTTPTKASTNITYANVALGRLAACGVPGVPATLGGVALMPPAPAMPFSADCWVSRAVCLATAPRKFPAGQTGPYRPG